MSNDLVREAGTMKRWVQRVRAGFLAIDRTYGAGVWRDLLAEGPSCGEPVPALRMSQCVKKHGPGSALLFALRPKGMCSDMEQVI